MATEAGGAVLDHACGATDLEQLVAETYEENAAACVVMAKLGMRCVRRFRLDAQALDGQPEEEGDEVARRSRLRNGGPRGG